MVRVCLLLGLLVAAVCAGASHNGTSTSVSVSDALTDREPAAPARRRPARRRNDSVRSTRSRLAHSCEEGGDLLTQWHRHCQIVLTAAVEGVDRERGTLNATLRRVIRSSVNASDWSFLSPPGADPSSANNLNPLPWRPAITLHGLFGVRSRSCANQFRIRSHDVLLFLVRVDPARKSLHLVSPPLRITLRNLRLIHSSPVQRIGEF